MLDKKILLIANPFGGTNKAMKVYETVVVPLLKLAGLDNYTEFQGIFS